MLRATLRARPVPALASRYSVRSVLAPAVVRPLNASRVVSLSTAATPARGDNTILITVGTLFGFMATVGTVGYMFLTKKKQREAVAALPLLEGNPVVFLDIEDSGKPVGRLVIQLRADVVPRAAENFRALCTMEYGFGYRTSPFYAAEMHGRVYGGDFYGTGSGGYSIYGDTFADESYEIPHMGPGMVGMRNWGPDTNNSQFYITFAAQHHLDGVSQVVGHVMEGFEVLDAINAFARSDGKFEPGHTFRVARCGESRDYAGRPRVKKGEAVPAAAEATA